MEQRHSGILFCSPCLCCGLVVRVSFASSCGDTVVNTGVWLVLMLVRVVVRLFARDPTTDCRQPNVRVRGQMPVPTQPLGSLLRIRPNGESFDKRLANKILIDKSHGKRLLGTLTSSSLTVYNCVQFPSMYTALFHQAKAHYLQIMKAHLLRVSLHVFHLQGEEPNASFKTTCK
jgi:hypothetical protein